MKRVTINDVAKVAGVSRQTVSRAMNDKGEISPATKERVMIAIDQLGYQPNRIAQSMVTRRTFTVGLVFPDILNPFFPEVARGVQDVAFEQGYNVFLCNTDDNPAIEENILRSLVSQPVDGIIILGSSLSDDQLRSVADNYHPIVMTNLLLDHAHINLLLVDNYAGGGLAAEHFAAAGHTQVGMIANQDFDFGRIRRVRGFLDKLDTLGLPCDASVLAAGAPTLEGGYAATCQLLDRRPDVSGIFAYNDLMAIGAMRACRDRNLTVPDDIAVIGFDDTHLTTVVSPSLSSIRTDKYAIGTRAMTRLLKMLEQPDKTFPQQSMSVELVLRESTRNVDG